MIRGTGYFLIADLKKRNGVARVVMNTPDSGKPPKSSDKIRDSLEKMRRTVEIESETGPLTDKSVAEHPILVATFYDRQLASKFREHLLEHKLFCDHQIKRGRVCISVDRGDSEVAAKLATEFRKLNPDRVPKNVAARFDFLIFGPIIAGALAVCFTAGSRGIQIVPFVFWSAVVGGLLGNLADRMRFRQRNKLGALSIGLWEFFVLTLVFAILFLLWIRPDFGIL